MVLKRVLVVAGLVLGMAGMALAANDHGPGGDGAEHDRVVKHRMHGGPGLEHMALRNIMAELLSARTGKSAGEIQALFESNGPHEAFDQLGISDEDHRALFKQAHTTLVNRMAAANLITPQQAEKARSAKIEMRVHRGPKPPQAPMPPEESDD